MSRKMKSIFSLAVFLFAIPLFMGAKAAPVSGSQIEEVTQKVFPCVVKVEVRNLMRKVATGVVIDTKGHIVTTALISPRDEAVFITTSDGERVEAEFLGMDSETHLAVIQAKEKKLTPIAMAKSEKLSPGAWIGVVSISPENTPQVTQGIVSSVADERVRLNVWVGRGMSGSPVVNRQGEMVGLLRGVYVDEQPIAFSFQEKEVVGTGYVFSKAEAPASGMAVATPVDIVDFVATEIKEKGKVARGWLGVRIWANEEDKVEIIEVEKDSPAEIADLKEGDIVIEFDGEEVVDTELLAKMIRMRKPGETVAIKIERKGKTQDVKVKLGELTEESVWSDFERKFPTLFAPKGKFEVMPSPGFARPDVFRFGFSQRKFIGVGVQELTPELSEFFGLDEGTGIIVSSLDKDGPAERAGLKVGDVIIAADGNRLQHSQDLVNLIQKKEKGDKITIEYLRNKKKRTIEVEIDEEERSESWQTLGYAGDYLDFWRDYQDTYQQQSKKLAETYKKMGENQYKQYMENQKKMNEQWQKQWEKQQKDAQRYYSDTFKTLRYATKKSKGIRV
ncbi:MAG: PDZ domain-containing protein [Candidatus Aminicenantes bacterium]|nr:MAG: PDZ domain-containing protein [Candidatus Aminicenantes bacterium]